MAVVEQVEEFLSLMPAVMDAPDHAVWLSYDAEADVLYVNFKKPSYADDSELTQYGYNTALLNTTSNAQTASASTAVEIAVVGINNSPTAAASAGDLTPVA